MTTTRYYIFLLLLFSLSLKAQKRPAILSGDIFQTEYFIENHGQFDAYKDGELRVKFGVENAGDHIYFNANGFVYHVKKVVPKDADKAKETKGKKEDDDANRKVIEGNITMRWLNANPHTQIECYDKSHHYFSYGDIQYKSYGYKKIIYRDLYPGIDAIYTIPAKGGVEYYLVVKPGADLSKVQFEYIGDDVKTMLSNNELAIKSNLLDLCERNLKATYSHSDSATCSYTLNKGVIGFNAITHINDTLVIDPWVGQITTFTNLPVTYEEFGCNVDYDYAGNLYVYGGQIKSYYDATLNPEVAKYSVSGNLLWTFSGSITSNGWTTGGGWGFIGGFVVDKINGNVYMGQGYNNNGSTIARIDSQGIFINFTTTAIDTFQEIWDMKYNCTTGDILGIGGSPASSQEIGIVNKSTAAFVPVNFTGLPTYAQDVVCTAFDKTGNLYAILASLSEQAVNNYVFKLTANLDGTVWSSYEYYAPVLSEHGNKAYINGNISNGANCLTTNQQYVFYYCGSTLIAFNGSNGTMHGTPYLLPNYTQLYEGGVYADDCNNIYAGGDSGNIKVFTFDGNTFAPQPDIVITGISGQHIYDIKYNALLNRLYVCGENFVATVTPSIMCMDSSLKINMTIGCDNIITTVLNPDTTSTYTYIWTDSSTNTLIKEVANILLYADTISRPNSKDRYTVMVIKNAECEAVSAGISFTSAFALINIKKSICKNSSYNFRGHIYTMTGVYIDTLKNSKTCDSIVTLNLTFTDTLTCIVNTAICQGQTYNILGHSYTTTGTYIMATTTKAECDSIVTLNLSINPLPVITTIASSSYICLGNNDTLNAKGAQTYSWQPVNITDSTIVVSPSTTTTYTVTGVIHTIAANDTTNCSAIDSVTVAVYIYQYKNAKRKYDTTIFSGDPIPIYALDKHKHYLWSPSATLSNDTAYSPIATPTVTTTYIALLTDTLGCHGQDTVTVFTKENCIGVYVPDAFTPNEDSKNDILRPLITHDETVLLFRVFNRWGQLMYESDNAQDGWDGRYKGKKQPTGTYIYYLKYQCITGAVVEKQGDVILLK